MARAYKLSGWRRAVNSLMRPLAKLGLAGPTTYVLVVPGRKTGKRYEVPVTLVRGDGERWLVSPYGEVAWVKNARAAGQVELIRARRTETVKLEPLEAAQAGPILKRYAKSIPIVRPFFDARPEGPAEEFAAEADRHPVFKLREV